ncbi:MAG: zf-HC2 domain-containing protein [Oscillospiraceae bacterium]|jgi:hypothetical protein|nr:zf-HC2 domain-containing protein [Oscillospiraceae bacterium]
MRDCDKYIELISALTDGELPEDAEAGLRTHIEACADCRRVYDAFAGISGALSQELVQPPERLLESVMQKISLQKKKKTGGLVYFKRFAAAAACLALILYGASYFGLFSVTKTASADSFDYSSASRGGSPAADVVPQVEPPEQMESGNAYSDVAGNAETEQIEIISPPPESDSKDGTVLQFGFPVRSLPAVTNGGAEENREPAFIFDAGELRVYEGKYYAAEGENDQNKLLFALTAQEDLDAMSALVTAMPDNTVAYTPGDGNILQNDPLYSIFFPATGSRDGGAADKTICIWFINSEIWCVIFDAETQSAGLNGTNQNSAQQNGSSGRILYKAEGMQDQFEAYVRQITETRGLAPADAG